MVKKTKKLQHLNLCDTHIHTRFCGHATGEMEDYVQVAIGKGLRKIIFLEHMEEGIQATERSWLLEGEFDHYFSIGQRLQEQYKDEIDIGLGVECGYNPHHSKTLSRRLQSRRWDQIGISYHFLKVAGERHHLNLLSSKNEHMQIAQEFGAKQLLEHYFSTLTEAIQQLPGTVLCHLDAALRFLPGVRLEESHYTQIDRLLQTAKKRQMAIEINTSGFAIGREQFPNRRILAMALSYGIPLVTGSDAHAPGDVGRHFDLVSALITPSPQGQ